MIIYVILVKKENCKSCYLNSEKCKECSKGFLFDYKCVETCPDGYYPDNENKECVKYDMQNAKTVKFATNVNLNYIK